MEGILQFYPLDLLDKIVSVFEGTDTEACPWEGFSLQQEGFSNTWGLKVILSGLHYTEVCLYEVKAFFRVLEPWEGLFLQLKDFPAPGTLRVQGQGEGFIL